MSHSPHSKLKRQTIGYYESKLKRFGARAAGVDWNSEESQYTRFAQLMTLVSGRTPFSLVDFGCGYGALYDFLGQREYALSSYQGFDISTDMVDRGRQMWGEKQARFYSDIELLSPADYAVASGLFNVKLSAQDQEWEAYVHDLLRDLDRLSVRGFAFNALTIYSDREKMRDDLYYADPLKLFEFCRKNFSRWVAVLHDYGLYEFTMIVRKDR